MVQDAARMAAYEEALRASVKPGSVVLDLGAGPGVLSCMALELGAARVYAVDTNPLVRTVRDLARKSGLASRLTVLEGDATTLEPPERVDLLIADLRGKLPVLGDNLSVLARARDRWLAHDGRMIPAVDTLYAAPATCPEARAPIDGWAKSFGGVDFSHLCELASSEPFSSTVTPEQLLAPGVEAGRIEYAALPADRPYELRLAADCVAERDGPLDGIVVWFDATLCPGVTLRAGPGTSVRVYGQQFFPLPKPIALRNGDALELRLRAQPTGQEYLWFWSVRLRREAEPERFVQHSTWKLRALTAATRAR